MYLDEHIGHGPAGLVYNSLISEKDHSNVMVIRKSSHMPECGSRTRGKLWTRLFKAPKNELAAPKCDSVSETYPDKERLYLLVSE